MQVCTQKERKEKRDLNAKACNDKQVDDVLLTYQFVLSISVLRVLGEREKVQKKIRSDPFPCFRQKLQWWFFPSQLPSNCTGCPSILASEMKSPTAAGYFVPVSFTGP